MSNLFVNVLRGIKKRLLQYLGIIILLVIVISTLSALYSYIIKSWISFLYSIKQ